MISTMDMTTGQWELDQAAPDVRLAQDGPALENVSVNAGLCECTVAQSRHAGIPVTVVMQDMDDFLARMSACSVL